MQRRGLVLLGLLTLALLASRDHSFAPLSWAEVSLSAIYWPGMWLISAPMLSIRGEGKTPEAAIAEFERLLSGLEGREDNLARTLGVEAFGFPAVVEN